jgi:Zn-dependent peptidase ImmA (M78 family)
MAFRTAGEFLLVDDREELRRAGKGLDRLAPAEGLARLRLSVSDGRSGRVVAVAYDRARRTRDETQPRGRLDIEGLLRSLGIEIRQVVLRDPGIDGAALWRADRALIVVNTSSPRSSTTWGRRSLLAHELYHLLYDTNASGMFGETTIDAVRTPSEPTANAFAAELLAPQRELPEFEGRLWANLGAAQQVVQNVCATLGVGRELALRQLQNRRRWPRPLVESLLNHDPSGQEA